MISNTRTTEKSSRKKTAVARQTVARQRWGGQQNASPDVRQRSDDELKQFFEKYPINPLRFGAADR